jgi:hypothetical protein
MLFTLTHVLARKHLKILKLFSEVIGQKNTFCLLF